LASRTVRAATLDFVSPFGEIFGCLTDAGFVARGSQPGGPYAAQFLTNFVSLRRSRGLGSLQFKVAVDYMINPALERTGWWEAAIAGWVYEIRAPAGALVLAFHWHPRNSGRVTWPHLHAYGTNDAVDLYKLHPPTGPITAGSVVQFLIEDLDVPPRRPNWQAVLDRHAPVWPPVGQRRARDGRTGWQMQRRWPASWPWW
jgi:hypothetical protein